MRVWLCMRVTPAADDRPDLANRQECLGVYTDEARARARCRIPERDFIGVLDLDVDQSEELIPWPGGYYPLLQDGPGAPRKEGT